MIMRAVLLISISMSVALVCGQAPVHLANDSLFTTPDWKEISNGEREGYVLTLTQEGNFEEDAGEQHNRPYRYLMGRWKVDTAAGTLTLSVDGQMGKTGVNRRYLRGRDFYLVYDIVSFNAEKLVLKDRLTKAIRTFKATDREEYVEPAMRRIPKPSKKPVIFEIPKGWGGV